MNQSYPEPSAQVLPKAKPGKWASGWYTIGDQRLYLRSHWEYRYGCYLEWLRTTGKIFKWEYEVDTYIFHEVQGNNRVYKPDFKVWTDEHTFYYDEVKGFYSPHDKTKMARMKKYYPDVEVRMIDEPVYREIERKLSHVIPGWHTQEAV